MSDVPAYADWLDAHAIDDALLGEAYEYVGPPARAVLKQCIARLHVLWGERPPQHKAVTVFRQGFTLQTADRPASFALVLCESSYAHPACLLAALIPATLAGVEYVIPCFITGVSGQSAVRPSDVEVPEPGLIAALELAGADRGVVVSEREGIEGLSLLHADLGCGRVVVLGSSGFGEPFVLAAHRLGIPCLSLAQPPLYMAEGESDPKENAFGSAQREASSLAVADACARLRAEALTLDVAHEGTWVWPDLGPDWFRLRMLRITE